MGNPKITLSPSHADTWSVCTMSAALCAKEHNRIPDFQETVYSVEGNQAHHVANALLLGKPVPTHYQGKPIPKQSLPEMITVGTAFRDHCMEGVTLGYMAEQNIKLWYMPERNGYIDFIGHREHGIKISDLKYGKGKAVNALLNKQMAIYARSEIEMSRMKIAEDEVIEMSIFQPRVRDGEPESTWEVEWAELREFTDNIGNIAKKIINAGIVDSHPDLEYKPSESTCQWCPAKLFCPARNSKPVALAKAQIAKKELPAPESLTEQQMLEILPHREVLKKWLDGVYKEAMHRVKTKRHIPAGWKLVRGRGSRRFIDPEQFANRETLSDLLTDDELFAEPKMKSVNQIQVTLKSKGWSAADIKDFLADHVEKFEGQLLLAPVSDPRPAVNVSAADLMDVIEDDDEEQLED